MKGLIKVTQGDHIFAIVLRKDFSRPGPNFFTPGEFSQQLGMLVHAKGKIVKRHRHKLVKREIFRTQEVLVLLEGKIKVELYNDKKKKLRTVIMKPGDAVLLARGGHKVKVLEAAKIIEVKQGPYAGFDDKEFF
jgi:mannose-6-phosphate isomerase-like protein (cupin superfamily)